MNRRPSGFRPFAVAATVDSSASVAAMSCRPYFRGGRSRGRRSYSGRPSGPTSGDQGEIVSGDSHFHAVRDANRNFRPAYTNVPPPPQYASGQQFYGPGSQSHRPGPPVPQQVPGLRPHKHPQQGGPAFADNQRFRPQQTPQQFKPRSSKPPDYREWERAKPGPPPHCERFTVLSYNILADYLAMDHWQKLYFHIPHCILDWNWRKKNICFELGLWSADILCFQEVDRFEEIEAELKARGYNGIWKMRTGDPSDGCAVFWRVSRFKLLHEESIEYNKLGLRDNVAQICVFESLTGRDKKNGASTQSTSSASSNRVIVCNIHVLFNPKRGDVKLGQIRVLLDRAHAVSKLWDDAPIVICGDFNCTPKSPLYNFMTGEKIDLSELPRELVSGQYSSEIHPSRRAYPDFRTQSVNDSQASTVNSTQSEIRGTHEIALSESSCGDIHCKTTKVREHVESNSHTLSEAEAPAANDNLDESSGGSASCEPTSGDDSISLLNEEVEERTVENTEDCDSFISELHSTGESLFPADSDSSSPNIESNSHGYKIVGDIAYVQREIITNMGNSSWLPSAWTPAETETATGNAECNIMEHPLKLTSAYAEVKSSSGLRDPSGEPLVTSYHRRFSGTVDYIWHSEGLQTARVLAPIPKHVMQHTRGFPTRKWGSDHIALVSEFAFTKDISSQNAIASQ